MRVMEKGGLRQYIRGYFGVMVDITGVNAEICTPQIVKKFSCLLLR